LHQCDVEVEGVAALEEAHAQERMALCLLIDQAQHKVSRAVRDWLHGDVSLPDLHWAHSKQLATGEQVTQTELPQSVEMNSNSSEVTLCGD
jgi:hypothetical protein